MESIIVPALSTLGHPQRLSIFRLLIRRYPDRLPAGEIATVLGIAPSTLSAYLTALGRVGLVSAERRGTSLRYRAEMGAVAGLFDALFLDCCGGRPDICRALPSNLAPETVMTDRKFNVLFICHGNSARSIFAESLLRQEAGDRFEAHSAGTRPRSELNPIAVTLLRDKGHDVSRLASKNIAVFQGEDAPKMDFVFTVCDLAANEDCGSWPGQPISAHWGVPDPVKATGTEAERMLAFQQAYGMLRNRLRAFTALPLETLDRIGLQRAADDIGRERAET